MARSVSVLRSVLGLGSFVLLACGGAPDPEPVSFVSSMFEGAQVPANLPLEDAQLHRDELCSAFQTNLREFVSLEEAANQCGGEALVAALVNGESDAQAVASCDAAISECLARGDESYYLRCPSSVVEGADTCRATLQVFAECQEAYARAQKDLFALGCSAWLTDESEWPPEECTSDYLPGSCGNLDFEAWPVAGTDFPSAE